MHRTGQDGWVEVVSGVMFSGKSEELMRRLRRSVIAGRRVQIFKSALDDRFGTTTMLRSHDGKEVEATPVRSARELRNRIDTEADVFGIDEVQFMDREIVDVVRWLADLGKRVVVAGTDLDFRGEPFGPMGELMAVAEVVDKLHAVCVKCGEPATRNQRLIAGHPAPAEGPVIQVGGAESYEARCRRCHVVPNVGRYQTELDIVFEADAWAARTRYW